MNFSCVPPEECFCLPDEHFCVASVVKLIHYVCVRTGAIMNYLHGVSAIEGKGFRLPLVNESRQNPSQQVRSAGVTIAESMPCKNHAIFHSTSDIYSLNSKLNIQIKFT